VSWVAPASFVVVHGAGSGPWIFDDWRGSFGSIEVVPIDLYERLDPASASMGDLADVVGQAVCAAPRPAAVGGWSMGGLVVMLAAQRLARQGLPPHSLVLIEASAPGELQGFDETVGQAEGTFDPEVVYGAFPDRMAARPESSRARAERKRGISIPSLPGPVLVVAGKSFPEERGGDLTRFYGAAELRFPDFDHWQLITEPAVREAIAAYLLTGRAGSVVP
jgi:pimeloyl-ACP methyl ester carboxylesterase